MMISSSKSKKRRSKRERRDPTSSTSLKQQTIVGAVFSSQPPMLIAAKRPNNEHNHNNGIGLLHSKPSSSFTSSTTTTKTPLQQSEKRLSSSSAGKKQQQQSPSLNPSWQKQQEEVAQARRQRRRRRQRDKQLQQHPFGRFAQSSGKEQKRWSIQKQQQQTLLSTSFSKNPNAASMVSRSSDQNHDTRKKKKTTTNNRNNNNNNNNNVVIDLCISDSSSSSSSSEDEMPQRPQSSSNNHKTGIQRRRRTFRDTCSNSNEPNVARQSVVARKRSRPIDAKRPRSLSSSSSSSSVKEYQKRPANVQEKDKKKKKYDKSIVPQQQQQQQAAAIVDWTCEDMRKQSAAFEEQIMRQHERGLETRPLYTEQEFHSMFLAVDVDLLPQHQTIEDMRTIKEGHVQNELSKQQDKALYGRTMHLAGKRILKDICRMQYWHVFCDVGHGIGNMCLQAAYTIGCEARGIELMPGRFAVSELYQENFAEQHLKLSDLHGKRPYVGNVRLRQGRLEAKEHREFLTRDVDFMFCNNFNDVLGCRSTYGVKHTPDDYLAGLFCLLKPGAVLVTLSELVRLPPTRKQINENRAQRNLPTRPDASFYDLQVIQDPGGEESFTFTCLPIKMYKYTRTNSLEATFLCDNPRCQAAVQATPIVAHQQQEQQQQQDDNDDDEERLLAIAQCPHCESLQRSKRKRRESRKPMHF